MSELSIVATDYKFVVCRAIDSRVLEQTALKTLALGK